MRRFITGFMLPALLVVAGCNRNGESSSAEGPALASESVKSYQLRGVVEGRDAATNALTVRHEDVPGLMEGMTMSFRVEGSEVDALPTVGEGVAATLNVAGPDYWLTDVRAAEIPPSLLATDETTTDTTVTSSPDTSSAATATADDEPAKPGRR